MDKSELGGITGDTPINPETGLPYPGGKEPVENTDLALLLQREGISLMDVAGSRLRDATRLPSRPNLPMHFSQNVGERGWYVAFIALNLRQIARSHGIEPIGNIEPTLLMMQALVGDIVHTPILRYLVIDREDINPDITRLSGLAWDALFVDIAPPMGELLQLVKNNMQTPENPITRTVSFAAHAADLLSLTEEAATGNMMVNRLVQDTLDAMRELAFIDKSDMQHVFNGIVLQFEELFDMRREESANDTE